MDAPRRFVAVLFVSLWTVVAAQPGAAALPADGELRELYKSALADLRAGRITSFQQAQHELRHYALSPYLQFEDLRRRMAQLRAADVAAFRDRWPDTPLADRLQMLWINELIRRSDWAGIREHYQPGGSTEHHCHYLRALYRTGEREGALAEVAPLWVVGKSQPKACDPIFEAWISAGGVTQELAWQRMLLALDERNPNLARYVRGFIRGERAGLAERALQIYRRPELIADTAAFSADVEPVRDLVVRGIRWLARTDPIHAEALWRRYRSDLSFDPADARATDHEVWIRLARAGVIVPHADLSPTPNGRHTQVAEALLMASIRQQHWSSAVRWVQALDEDDRRQPRWQYWLARAIVEESNGDAQAQQDADAMLRELARLRHYYGFLAAHRTGVATTLNQHASAAHPLVLAQVAQRAAMHRIAELHGVGDVVNARREWQFMYPRLTEVEQVAAVHLIAQIGWVDQAIHGANAAQLLDDIELRFPTPFLPLFQKESQRAAVPAGLLFGIARQESAFATSARSSAGALGLMQLMPATAAQVSTQLGISASQRSNLLEPELNVRLGAEYMRYLLQRYSGHRVHAAAAYNAGPSRVDRWVRDGPDLPVDAWIEVIPFAETRNYVKNVLAFSYIYSKRLGEPAAFLDREL
jgi:soluble lytic murein transglycosylase